MTHSLVNTFQINNRINLYVLEAIAPENLMQKAGGKGRSVGEQWAHIHNVRLMWLDVSAPDLKGSIEKIEKERADDKELLIKALTVSAEAISAFIERSIATGKVKNFKPNPEAFVGYLLAHEAHHRGQIVLTLKLAGVPIDKKIGFGMWEWGIR